MKFVQIEFQAIFADSNWYFPARIFSVTISTKTENMNQILKIYLRTFLFSLALIGIIPPIAEFCFFGTLPSARGILFDIVLVAVIAFVLTIAHVWGVWNAVRASGRSGEMPDFEARQTLEINVGKTPTQIFEQLRNALQPLKWQLLAFDKATGLIKCETSPMMSNGETVTISVEPVAEKQSKVRVVSEPIHLINLAFFNLYALDFGKNRRNINLVERIVNA